MTNPTIPASQNNDSGATPEKAREDLSIALSAYLDNALSASERARVTQRLDSEPEVRAELERLRELKTLLGQTPRLTVPRDFTLDATQFGRIPWWASFRTMQRLGGIGVAAALILIAAGSLLDARRPPAAPSMSRSEDGTAIAALYTQTATFESTESGAALDGIIATDSATTEDRKRGVPTIEPAEPQSAGDGSVNATAVNATATSATALKQPPQATAQASPPLQATIVLTTAAFSGAAIASPAETTSIMSAAPVTAPTEAQGTASSDTAANAETGSSSQSDQDDPGSSSIAQSTPLPTATLILTSTATATSTITATLTATATVIPITPPTETTPTASPPSVPLLQIIGLTLLIFSGMLFGVGYMRSRVRT